MSKAAVNNTAETRMIALADLRVAEWNARKTIDLETLAGLTESLKLHGVQVPLIVRPRPGAEGYTQADSDAGDLSAKLYEIIAGHRRFKAAAILKLAKLPCIVRELDDVAAREIGLVDNLQREDVPAMEEAEAFGELLDRLLSIAAVAARVGKEQGYVAKRLKLRTCTEHTRRALSEQLITVDHALLLARLGEDEQNAALKWTLDHSAGQKKPVDKVITEIVERRRDRAEKFATDPDSYGYYRHHDFEPQSIVGLKAHIADESGTPLARAPWALDDANLMPDVGACAECPQNTKANAPLFGDLDMAEPTCTDGGCFKAKTEAFVLIRLRTAEPDKTQAPIRVSWKVTATPPRMDIGEPCDGPAGLNNFTRVPNLKQVFKRGQWIEATKKCAHTCAAVSVDWSDANNRGYMGRGEELRKPGELVSVCVQPKCKAHPKAYEQRQPNNSQSRVDPKEEKRREAEREHVFKVEREIREQVFNAILARIDVNTAIRLAAHEHWNSAEVRKVLFNAFPKIDGHRLEALTLFFVLVGEKCKPNGYRLVGEGGPKEDRKRTWELAKAVGVDADVIVSNFFHNRGIDPREERLRTRPSSDKPAAKKTAAKKAAAKPVKKTPAKKKAAKKGGGR